MEYGYLIVKKDKTTNYIVAWDKMYFTMTREMIENKVDKLNKLNQDDSYYWSYQIVEIER